jgi:hypothetical protein
MRRLLRPRHEPWSSPMVRRAGFVWPLAKKCGGTNPVVSDKPYVPVLRYRGTLWVRALNL